jgi:hypothetical protein
MEMGLVAISQQNLISYQRRIPNMKGLLLVIMLIALAISGCTEKGPSVPDRNVAELKNLSAPSAENLSSFAVHSLVAQTMKLNAGANANEEKTTAITESLETLSSVNLSAMMVHVSGSTKSKIEVEGQPENNSETGAEVYLIGNSTYLQEQNGNWTHLIDPRAAEEVWSEDKNNQVLSLARTFNLSQLEDMGSESVEGEDSQKFRIVTASADETNLFNIAFAVAAKVTQYPMNLPSINRSELNKTAKMEKTIWISKKSTLPVKYESAISFSMTPEIIGAMNLSTGQMEMFNQSRPLGEISVSVQTSDRFYDFDKPTSITLPEEALSAPALSPATMQPASGQ